MSNFKYQYILAIAELQSFSKAADALLVSQPYLSKVVSAIEHELGVKLFDRSRSPLTVTEAGKCYIEYIKIVLDAEKHMLDQISAIQKLPKKELALGMGRPRVPLMLPPLVERMARIYPDVKLNVSGEGSKSVLAEKVVNGSLDLAFFTSPIIPPSVSHVFLGSELIIMVLPSNEGISPQAVKTGILEPEDLNILKSCRFILLTETHGMGLHARRMLDMFHIAPKSLYEVSGLEEAHRLAATGFGAAVIPESWVNRIKLAAEPFYYRIGHPPLTRDVVMIYKKGRTLSQVEKTVCRLAQEVMKESINY